MRRRHCWRQPLSSCWRLSPSGWAQAAPQQAPPTAPPAGAGRGAPGAGAPPQVEGAARRPSCAAAAPGDPEAIKRGNGLCGVYCRACHGTDLRGGDQGRSEPPALAARAERPDSELILPVVQQGRQRPRALAAPPRFRPTVKAIATYIHSVTASARGRGAPPKVTRRTEYRRRRRQRRSGLFRRLRLVRTAADMEGIATPRLGSGGAPELLGGRRREDGAAGRSAVAADGCHRRLGPEDRRPFGPPRRLQRRRCAG